MTQTPHSQRGASLVVGLIMLVIITLMVTQSLTLSTTNLQSAGNMQYRDEAIAAANMAIEATLALSTVASGHTEPVDLNRDGTNDYTVAIVRSCLRALAIAGSSETGRGSSVTFPVASTSQNYMVLWDYQATITDSATGTAIQVHQGINQRVSQSQCNTLCPPALNVDCS
ncbi:MAG: pilus assembly PilX N-terminal domain-containing protein [Azoarcus sp.]|nr:pilus assembly PilX N-terminal domain-containing protein [Azoarcus sp.]